MGTIGTEFVNAIDQFIGLTKSMSQTVNREIVLEIGRELVNYSPIGNPTDWHPAYWPKGYEPGLFINNWQVGIDEIPQDVINEPDASGQAALERLSHLGRWTIGHTYYFVNNVRNKKGEAYGEYLEMGWSPQCPPQGMVGRVSMNFQNIVDQATAKVIANQQWAFTGA